MTLRLRLKAGPDGAPVRVIALQDPNTTATHFRKAVTRPGALDFDIADALGPDGGERGRCRGGVRVHAVVSKGMGTAPNRPGDTRRASMRTAGAKSARDIQPQPSYQVRSLRQTATRSGAAANPSAPSSTGLANNDAATVTTRKIRGG